VPSQPTLRRRCKRGAIRAQLVTDVIGRPPQVEGRAQRSCELLVMGMTRGGVGVITLNLFPPVGGVLD